MSLANLAPWAGFVLLMGIATAALARHRRRGILSWFFVGVLVWFVAIPWLFFTKSRLADGQAAPSGMAALAIVAICAAMGLRAVEVLLTPATLPNCDTYLGVSDLQAFVANSPVGKASGLKLVKLTDIKEVSRSATELKCTATAQMNTAATVPMDYRFFIENGKRLVDAEW